MGWNILEFYRFEQHLGEGSFGQVYQSVRLSDNHPVAVKRIRIRNLGYVIRLCRELEISQEVDNENVLVAVDVLVRDGSAYILFPVMDMSLHRLCHGLKINQEDSVREIMRQVFQAVHYLHSEGILHRDLKPGNILVNYEPESNGRPPIFDVKICDFGAARKAAVNRCTESVHDAAIYST